MKKLLLLLLLSVNCLGQTIDLNQYYNNVRGDDLYSRSTGTTSATNNAASGFYTINDQVNYPNAAGWPFHSIKVRQSGQPGTSIIWSWELASHLKTGALYSNYYDAQLAAWQGYKRIHENRWFPVNESIAPTNGQLMIGDGAQFSNGYQKHITGGSTTPTVSTSTGAGTSPTVSLTASSEVSTDISGVISLTTGTSPTSGLIVRVTFAGGYARYPKITIDGLNDAAVLNRTLYRVSNRTTTSFDIVNTSTNALPASTTFLITYTVTE